MMRDDDVVLGVLPLFHVYGLNAVLGGVLRHGCTLVLAERFDPQGTLDLVEAEQCTVLPLAPAVFPHWRDVEGLRERLASVRLVLSGSAPLAPEVVADFTRRTGIPLHQGYGLTEASPVVTSTLCSEQLEARVGRCGAARRRAAARRLPRARPRGRGPGRDRGPRRPPLQRLLARRFRRSRRRRLVADRRRRVPRRRPATCSSSTGSRSWSSSPASTSTPSRSRRSSREVDGVVDVAVIGVPDERDRRGGRRLRPRPRRRPRRGRGRRTGAVRGAAGPVQAAEPGRGGRRAAADGHRQGAEGPAARAGAAPDHGAARVTARVTLYGRQGCHLCDAARETVARVCAELGESFEEVDVDTDPRAARALHRGGAGDLRRRPAARLLAGRRAATRAAAPRCVARCSDAASPAPRRGAETHMC